MSKPSPHEDARQHVSHAPFEVGPVLFDMPQLASQSNQRRRLAPAWLAASTSQSSDAITHPCRIRQPQKLVLATINSPGR